MGNSRVTPRLTAICATMLILSFYRVNGQISTPCTSSMINSFTPCLNFITGSSANGQSSPSADCCNSVKSMMSDSVDCACLIITGNIPLSLPFNRTLAITLPQVCNGGVPLRCKSTGVPLPAPGPVLFGPTQAPTSHAPSHHAPVHAPSHHAPVHAPSHHAPIHAPFISPRASKVSSTLAPPPIDDTTPEITPASPSEASPSLAPAAHPGIKPVLNPAPSASTQSYSSVPSLLVMMLMAIMVFQTQLY